VAAGFKMVSFLQKYTEVMNLQIQAIQEQVDESVGGVMKALQDLSTSTEARKKEADSILEATYLAPDANTAKMVDDIQKSTDDIFEQAQRALEQGSAAASPKAVAVTDTTSDIRRMGGMFSKHMESISTMDDSMKDLVMTMVGSLSNTDVIKQRLDHIAEMLRAMNLGIGNVIVDLDNRLHSSVVENFKENLLDFSYKSYSIEEERDAFKAVFGAPPNILKAYSAK
jgi:hypothetical protein